MLKFYADVGQQKKIHNSCHVLVVFNASRESFFFRGDIFLSFLNTIRATQSKLRYLNLSNFTANTV